MKLSRKEKNSYWMPYTDNEWFKKNPRLLDSANGMYYKTNSGKKKLSLTNIKIPLLGLHNIRNATASLAVSITIGVSREVIKKGLKEFKGVERRFN